MTMRARGWWRPGRRTGVVAIGTGVLLLLAWTGLDLWAGRRARNEIARLEARYGRLDGQSPRADTVPGNDNRARPIRAAVLLNFPSGSSTDLGGSEIRAAVSRLRQAPDASAIPGELRGFVERNADAIRIAQLALDRPRSSWDADYPGAYSAGFNTPPWLALRGLSNLLYTAARLDMHDGRTDDAARMIATGLAVSASLRQEPSLIAQLIRIAIAEYPCDAIRRLLSGPEVSDVALRQLAHWLEENRHPEPGRAGLLAELRFGSSVFDRLERGTFSDRAPFGEPSMSLHLARIGRPFVRLAHARYLANMDRLFDLESGVRPRPHAFDAPLPGWWNWRRLSDSPMRGLERAIDTGDTFANMLAVTEIGVALRRYRLDRGRYPNDLSALVPAYVPRIPPDRVTGAPLTYQRSGNGFTLKAAAAPTTAPNTPPFEWDIAK